MAGVRPSGLGMDFKRGIIRWLALWLVALSAVLVVKVQDATSPHNIVAACTYNVEWSNTATKNFYSVYYQATDTLHAQVVTYAGNLGSGYQCPLEKQYKVYQWTTLGTPGSYFSEVRTWDCGQPSGTWTANSNTVWSGQLHYPQPCGRQADDLNSYFHDSSGGENVSVYVNQG